MAPFEFEKQPHRRLNPLTGDWVLVSPGRTARPWKGQTEAAAPESVPRYDPECYMCPGNARAGGERNPPYTGTFVFENDYAALRPGGEPGEEDVSGLLVARAESGICRVVCFSPQHDLTLAKMSAAELRAVVETWTEQYRSLGSERGINSVMIFENRGAMMGASNPHPHGQIWANATVPNEPAKEQAAFAAYQRQHSDCLLCEYLKIERDKAQRVVCENEEFAAVVPFWAVWPFETMVVSKRHAGSLEQLSEAGREALAEILHRVTARYDNLFSTAFPYSMGLHQRATDGEAHSEWHFHAHFYPPLLRSAVVRKFMVGYELLGAPQRDITPEEAAGRLREAGEKQP
ncbi:MAG: UDP-glucose--hexose-1-phosphate uridylyltransferase [Candidatus Acidiferrales bacterium]